ncbi:MAG: FkbM family methyltransferase [Saprospiraceae bacterium]|mgnify:CR=1 FL=1|nr:FkbM family methyltransferase [Saprospiraceae bacterium]MDZ4705457.1 FkbM family methyltransferase [Saprospiraceae bacterium]
MNLINKILYNLPESALKTKLLDWRFGKAIQETDLVYNLFKGSSFPKTMIDVGAHFGDILEKFAKDGWVVFAFEPDPANRKLLEGLCSGYPAVKIFAQAVSDLDAPEMALYTSRESSGISSLTAFHESHVSALRVPVTTLKTTLSQHPMPAITFLKTDAEGFDLKVLQGFDWENHAAPECIVCEFEDGKTKLLGYMLSDMVDFLEKKGYRCLISEWHPIKRYGIRHQWKAFRGDPAAVSADAWGNILAVKPPLWDKLLHLTQKI